MTDATGAAELRPLQVEMNGINVIAENERKGHPRDLFWPWFAANISVLGLSYGSFVLGFGISFWQALVVGVLGIVLSFLACGFIALAGKRGSAPTMVLSRAAFGVNGNKLPTVISWLLTVGWENVLVILATLATATVFHQLGWGGGTLTKVIALIVVVALTIFGGVMGFDLIMRMQTVITIVTGVLTVVFCILVVDHIHWHTVSAIHSGDARYLRCPYQAQVIKTFEPNRRRMVRMGSFLRELQKECMKKQFLGCCRMRSGCARNDKREGADAARLKPCPDTNRSAFGGRAGILRLALAGARASLRMTRGKCCAVEQQVPPPALCSAFGMTSV